MATIGKPSGGAAERVRAPMPRRWTDAARRNAERTAFADAPRLTARYCRERAAEFTALLKRDPLQAGIYRAGRRVWLTRARAARAATEASGARPGVQGNSSRRDPRMEEQR